MGLHRATIVSNWVMSRRALVPETFSRVRLRAAQGWVCRPSGPIHPLPGLLSPGAMGEGRFKGPAGRHTLGTIAACIGPAGPMNSICPHRGFTAPAEDVPAFQA